MSKLEEIDWDGGEEAIGTIDGVEHHATVCNDEGEGYWEGDNGPDPTKVRISESTYKGREDAELISTIKELGRTPGAEYWSGTDCDGDHEWVVLFEIKNFAVFKDGRVTK